MKTIAASKQVESALSREQWADAIRICRHELSLTPGDHWWWARLSTALYEQRHYRRALVAAAKSLELAPSCPLALWEYAGCLDMLGREEEAIGIWKQLVRRGTDRIANDACGEGQRWSESLVNDCRYRIARAQADLGLLSEAGRWLKKHMQHRRPGLPSIYPKGEVERWARRLALPNNGHLLSASAATAR